MPLLRLRCGGVDVVVVGTCHTDERSLADVRDAIRGELPAAVVVELCPMRVGANAMPSLAGSALARFGDSASFTWPGFSALQLALYAGVEAQLLREGDDDDAATGLELATAIAEGRQLGIPVCCCRCCRRRCTGG
jgi:pheromone shutdown protein TraB